MRWWRLWRTRPDALPPHGRRARRAARVRRADVALAAGLALLTAALYLGGLFERLELIAIDHRYRLLPAPIRSDILLVLIDSSSLRRVPHRWPWPRSVHARLTRALNAAGARAIGYDVGFDQPGDPTDDAELVASVTAAGNVVLAVFQEEKVLPDGTRVHLGSPLMPELRAIGAAAGTISLPEDIAGGIRRTFLEEQVVGDPYWAFAVEVVRRAEGLSPDLVRWEGPGRLRLGDRIIQGARHDRVHGPVYIVYIDYAGGAGTFPSVSASDVLDGRLSGAELRKRVGGKVVLVGASAIDLQDLHPSPFPGVMPGVEIEANLVNGFLRGVAARRLAPWVTLVFLAILAAAWSPAAALVARGPVRAVPRALRIVAATAFAVAGLAAAAAVLFWQWRLFLDVVPLLAASGAMGVGSVVLDAVRTARRAALSTVTLAPGRPGPAGAASPLEQAVDVLFAALHDWMQVEVVVVELRRGTAPPERAPLVRTARGAPLGEPSAACQEWSQRAFAGREGFLVARLGEAFGAAGPGAPPMHADGSAFVPLLAGGQGMGVLQAHRSTSPFEADDLRVLAALAAQLALAAQNMELVQGLRTLTLGTMAALADAVEARDAYTGGHSERVSDYSVQLAQAAGLPPAEVEQVRFGSLIHDIGKIGIADGILGKAAALTEEEWRQMQQHTLIGERIIAQLPVGQAVRDIILYHHERYDGTGYPRGLRGEAIPIAARIVAVADAYEALTSGRVYRGPVGKEAAQAELRRAAGVHLDPHLVALFLQVLEAEGGVKPSPPASHSGDPAQPRAGSSPA